MLIVLLLRNHDLEGSYSFSKEEILSWVSKHEKLTGQRMGLMQTFQEKGQYFEHLEMRASTGSNTKSQGRERGKRGRG